MILRKPLVVGRTRAVPRDHCQKQIRTRFGHAAEERMLRCLGSAVIMQWNDLPTEIQRKLFVDASSMTDLARQFELKQQIARFLHEHKDDV